MNDAKAYLAIAGIDCMQIGMLQKMGYFEKPASKSHHLTGYGGLAQHSANVTRRLVELTNALKVKWPRDESPYLVGMLHDLVKCRCYRLVGESAGRPVWEYVEPEYPGHGICSVAIAAEMGIRLQKEEIVAITYHMGLYNVEKEYTFKEFDNVLKDHAQQVLATCLADWWAARIDEEGVWQ